MIRVRGLSMFLFLLDDFFCALVVISCFISFLMFKGGLP